MLTSAQARLNRLFNASGRCLDIAIDHGVFNEYAFLDGLADMPRVVQQVAAAGPDAIQMNLGQGDLLQAIPGKAKPALVLRVDVTNVYNAQAHRVMFDVLQDEADPVLAAVKLDAACVVCNLLLVAGEPDLHRQTLQNMGRVRAACDRYGMPLMVEPLVMRANDGQKGYRMDGGKQLLVPLVRQARELGADIIKADPTEHAEDYHEVVEAARCPVLVRGGGKADLQEVFRRSHAYLAQGAAGLVYGRNVYQHAAPARIVRALMALIHEGAGPDAAWQIYQAMG
jgi:class I fructose-bisphosphate aldolase